MANRFIFLYHTSVMVDNSQQMIFLVGDQHHVDFVEMHEVEYVIYLRFRQHRFGSASEDVFHLAVEEFLLPAFHGPSDVAVGDEPDYLVVLVNGDSQSELALADMNYGVA